MRKGKGWGLCVSQLFAFYLEADKPGHALAVWLRLYSVAAFDSARRVPAILLIAVLCLCAYFVSGRGDHLHRRVGRDWYQEVRGGAVWGPRGATDHARAAQST